MMKVSPATAQVLANIHLREEPLRSLLPHPGEGGISRSKLAQESQTWARSSRETPSDSLTKALGRTSSGRRKQSNNGIGILIHYPHSNEEDPTPFIASIGAAWSKTPLSPISYLLLTQIHTFYILDW